MLPYICQGQLMWCFYCQPHLHNFRKSFVKSFVKIGHIIAEIMIFITDDLLDLHFQGQLIWHYCCWSHCHHFCEGLTKTGHWDTAFFVNGDLDLHFQGQMIRLYVADGNAIIVFKILNWLKDRWDISKICETLSLLWPWSMTPSIFYLIDH